MEHLLLKATTVAADQGTFEAVISTANVDRDGDIVEPSAMVNALAKWAKIGKLVPLAWNHTDEVIGHIDPATVVVADGEVIAKGVLDQSVPRYEEAWRLVKSGTLSFSFGYLFDPKNGGTPRKGGGYVIKELDLYEISVIPIAPANNDTRVVSWKAAEEAHKQALTALQTELEDVKGQLAKALDDLKKAEETGKESVARPVDPLKEAATKAALDVLTGGAQPPAVAKETPKPVPGPEMDPDDLRKRSRDLMLTVLTGIEVTT